MKTILLTIVFGVLTLAVDWHFEHVILTPFFSLTWLMIMARTEDWKHMLAVFGVLVVFVAWSLIGENAMTFAVRICSFLIAGSLAVAFSRARQRAQDTLSSTHSIIRAIPAPVVVADITGSIVTASNVVSEWMPDNFGEIVGHSFADIFLGHLPPGRAMKKFLDWFHIDGMREELLYLRSQCGSPIPATIMTTGEGKNRLLVAAIHEQKNI